MTIAVPTAHSGRSRVKDVAQALRAEIQAGERAPGAPLREVALAEAMGVSRATIREALRHLAADGLVQVEKFRGARVSSPTAFELFDQFEIRAALFGMSARYACFRASDSDLAEIVARIRNLVETAASQSAAWRVEEGVEIGSMISRHAGPDARAILAGSHRKARWHLSSLGLDERGFVGPVDEWRRLASGLEARDADAASDAARRIIFRMQQEVTQAVIARGGPPDPA
ncbi:MAG: GntR family transcriptional regulator [Phenylobacterium sp.]|nr:MAG: GntR family transcriptional regulator [Phenylobacterium sp.]